jgi:hypothetical protein
MTSRRNQKPTREQIAARQARRDLERYEAAMREKREHERRYGPIRPRGCAYCGDPYCDGVTNPSACSYNGARP